MEICNCGIAYRNARGDPIDFLIVIIRNYVALVRVKVTCLNYEKVDNSAMPRNVSVMHQTSSVGKQNAIAM